MPQILIVVGWLIAFGCLLYLAVESLKIRFSRPRRKKLADDKISLFQKLDPFARKRARAAQNNDGAVLPAPHEARAHFPRGVGPFGYVLLVVWEGYWILDVAERFSKAATPLKPQLPYYFFLLFVTVAVPLAAYLAARRLLRRSVQSP